MDEVLRWIVTICMFVVIPLGLFTIVNRRDKQREHRPLQSAHFTPMPRVRRTSEGSNDGLITGAVIGGAFDGIEGTVTGGIIGSLFDD